jgi:hypothetical protein
MVRCAPVVQRSTSRIVDPKRRVRVPPGASSACGNALVAQRSERRPLKPRAAGSSPAGGMGGVCVPVKLSRQERPFRKREVRSSNLRTGLARGGGLTACGAVASASLIRRRSLVRIQPRRLWDSGEQRVRTPVAQRIERRVPNPQVAGSSPAGGVGEKTLVWKANPPGRGACLENRSDGCAVWGSRPPPSASLRERRLRGNDRGSSAPRGEEG